MPDEMPFLKVLRWASLFGLLQLVVVCLGVGKVAEEEKHAEYWHKDAQKMLTSSLLLQKNQNKAKNVILFLGDGMGMSTITSMRIMKGQMKGKTGEEEHLVFDDFPFVSLSKTYGTDKQTSDSANTATAYLCGVKANYGTIGVDGRVLYENCSSSLDRSTHVPSIMKWAQDEGKWTGFVTSTRVTHASPAGTFAHTASRDWEGGSPDPRCPDIAQQLIHGEPGKNFRVILGGGRMNFIPRERVDVEGIAGVRNDSHDLLQEWRNNMNSKKLNYKLIYDAQELKAIQPQETDYLMGLFHSDHLPYVADRPDLNKEYPTLTEMTETAINILKRNEDGFVLFVEGGKIDLAHHANWARKALEEGVEFDAAIERALALTDSDDTLIVVTADHSHTFTVGGDYPLRGNNIVGLGGVSDIDHKTFTTLGYHSGPGYKKESRDRNLTEEEAVHKEFRIDTQFPMVDDTHGAEDVPVYATGPMSHLFRGVHEQSYIAHVMAYAACLGPNQQHCSDALALVPKFFSVALVAMVNFCLSKVLLS